MLKAELRQNFTVDPSVLDDVAKALKIESTDHIVEIGAGKGMLSQKILNQFKNAENEPEIPNLLSYEVDEELRYDLEGLKNKSRGKFDFRIQNFLDAKPKQGFNKCTGNIPYHISEPLFFKFISWDFDEIAMITGIKFARKIVGDFPGKLSLISSYLFDSNIDRIYGKNIFFPKSKVDSALLIMRKKTEWTDEKEKLIAKVMRNTDKKDHWLNNFLGYDQGQKGQIYHMDLEKLIETIRSN